MTLEIIAPLTLVSLGAVIIIYTQLLAPRMVRQRISQYLTGKGWMRVPPERDYTWTDIMTLAIEDLHGATRVAEHDENFGPVTLHSKRKEDRSGRTLALFQDTGAHQRRYAGLGVLKTTVVYSQRGRFPFWGGGKKKYTTAHELWIGEARHIAVKKPEKVYNAMDEIFGSAGRKMALNRGVDPDVIPELASPSEVSPARKVRELLQKTSMAQSLLAKVLLGPQAWVMVIPLSKVGQLMGSILGLADEISAVMDRKAGGNTDDSASDEGA